MIRFSPSSTVTYRECPLKWALSQSGLVGEALQKKDIAAWIGSAIASGMEYFHKTQLDIEEVMTGSDEWLSPSLVVGKGHQELQSQMERALGAGRIIPPELEVEVEESFVRVQKGLEYLVGRQPLRPSWVTKGAEFVLADWGNARIDLLVEAPEGLIVVDYKTKVTATSYILGQAEEDYRWSNQLYHYVAALRSEGHQVDFTAICMLVIEPRPKINLWVYDVDEDYLSQLTRTWERQWPEMAAVKEGNLAPRMALEHRGRFGLCEYHQYCLEGKLSNAELFGFLKQERS